MMYGYCPICGTEGIRRERRPDGNDTCSTGHVYPSQYAVFRKREVTPLAEKYLHGLPVDEIITALTNWSNDIPDIRARSPKNLVAKLLEENFRLQRIASEKGEIKMRDNVVDDSLIVSFRINKEILFHAKMPEEVFQLAISDVMDMFRDWIDKNTPLTKL